MHCEHQFIHGVSESEQMQVWLKTQRRVLTERSKVRFGQGFCNCAVIGLNIGPLQACYIERDPMAPRTNSGCAASHCGSFAPRLRSVKEVDGFSRR
jgi:hypothetical protein